MSTAGETACTYACLLLHDDDLPVTSENIVEVLKAANVKVDSYWPPLFAKLCAKKNIDDLLLSAVSTGGAAAAAPAAAAPAAAASAPPAEEKKEEVKEESEDEGGLFGLFD